MTMDAIEGALNFAKANSSMSMPLVCNEHAA